MDDEAVAVLEQQTTEALRAAGARFAFVHGSRARGTHRPDSDLDVAAWWDGTAPPSFEVRLPDGVDLMVLNGAPLELAGRISVEGRLLFDDDPPARVRWVATTRKIYFDEKPRFDRGHREFLEMLRRGR
ncbi:nucleotidyltransferase domain-containing protein [Blastococcus saxobsidens]|uniref:Putative nucleotidyltransferases n=1 Tax=Blastococcus saxobsidens (strain DD2) TaxID=1146883 RepID=H6RLS7_BLASD|nr:nucleotidyltransferase domain-containing protein [Blastococcus saxobsidens]CCG05006.1 putative nucleotidyltransferases [Blastococcus saxobsidens DD2]